MSLLYGTLLAIILETNIFFPTVSPNRLDQLSQALSKTPWVASRDFSSHSSVRTVFLHIMKLMMKSKQNLSFSFTISAWEWGWDGGFSRLGGKVFRLFRTFLVSSPSLSLWALVWSSGDIPSRNNGSAQVPTQVMSHQCACLLRVPPGRLLGRVLSWSLAAYLPKA